MLDLLFCPVLGCQQAIQIYFKKSTQQLFLNILTKLDLLLQRKPISLANAYIHHREIHMAGNELFDRKDEYVIYVCMYV